jgi:Ser/Thr protein kinase RdoA (MazF antagonist)
VSLPAGHEISRRLLGRTPDEVQPLLDRPDRVVYLVSIGPEQFVCKAAADDDLAMAREAEGQRHAAAGGIPVPELVATADGQLASRFVTGVPLTEMRSLDAWRAAGRMLRRVHALEPIGAWGEGLDAPAATWRASIEADLAHGVADCVRELGFDAGLGAQLRDTFAAAAVFDAPIAAWCHGDCQPDHLLFDPDTHEIVAIIDWSDHGKADAAWDIAVLTLDDEAMTDAVLDGYQADADARAHFAASLPILRIARHLGEAYWLFAHGYPYEDSLRAARSW